VYPRGDLVGAQVQVGISGERGPDELPLPSQTPAAGAERCRPVWWRVRVPVPLGGIAHQNELPEDSGRGVRPRLAFAPLARCLPRTPVAAKTMAKKVAPTRTMVGPDCTSRW